MRVYAEDDPGRLCDYIAANTPLKYTDKQAVLECQRVMDRLQLMIVTLGREAEIWGLDREISEKLKEQLELNQREYYMREQIKILQNELGDADNNSAAAEGVPRGDRQPRRFGRDCGAAVQGGRPACQNALRLPRGDGRAQLSGPLPGPAL